MTSLAPGAARGIIGGVTRLGRFFVSRQATINQGIPPNRTGTLPRQMRDNIGLVLLGFMHSRGSNVL